MERILLYKDETNPADDGLRSHPDAERSAYMYQGLSSLLHKEYSDKGSPYGEYYNGPNGEVVSKKMFGLHGLINPAKEPDLDTNGGLMYYGDLIESYRYEAFGGIFEGITAPYNTSSYTGHQYDDAAGLMDMKARWYDPQTAGFLSEDTYPGTLTTPFTQNRYAYVGNNPINMWDPTGHVPDWVEAKSDHVDYYGDHIDSFWWKKWTYQSYNVSYSSAWLAGSTKDERNIYETYAQNQYETWNYHYQYSRTIFDEDDNVIDIVGDNWNETYNETELYSWTNTISAANIAGQNRTVLQSYGSPPANAEVIASYSTLNGQVISARLLLDSNSNYYEAEGPQADILAQAIDFFSGQSTFIDESNILSNVDKQTGIVKVLEAAPKLEYWVDDLKKETEAITDGGIKGVKKGKSNWLATAIFATVGALLEPRIANEGEQEWLNNYRADEFGLPLLSLDEAINMEEDNNHNYVFRAINDLDVTNLIEGNGIVAKNPYGLWSLTSHVAYGSKRNMKPELYDPWISTTIDLSLAQKVYDHGNGIIVIDLDKVTSEYQWVLTSLDPTHTDYEMALGYARRDKEYSIFQFIDRSAIVGWIPTYPN